MDYDKILKQIEMERKYKEEFLKNKRELKSISKAIIVTSKEFNVSKRTIIDFIDYESYVGFLIEEKAIPDIDSRDYIDKEFGEEYLNAIGE